MSYPIQVKFKPHGRGDGDVPSQSYSRWKSQRVSTGGYGYGNGGIFDSGMGSGTGYNSGHDGNGVGYGTGDRKGDGGNIRLEALQVSMTFVRRIL